jgi:hypothetical protein
MLVAVESLQLPRFPRFPVMTKTATDYRITFEKHDTVLWIIWAGLCAVGIRNMGLVGFPMNTVCRVRRTR